MFDQLIKQKRGLFLSIMIGLLFAGALYGFGNGLSETIRYYDFNLLLMTTISGIQIISLLAIASLRKWGVYLYFLQYLYVMFLSIRALPLVWNKIGNLGPIYWLTVSASFAFEVLFAFLIFRKWKHFE